MAVLGLVSGVVLLHIRSFSCTLGLVTSRRQPMCTSPISKCTSVCALRPCGNICLNPASPATSCLRVHPATARCDAHRGAWPLARRRLRLLAFGRCWAWPLGRLLRSALRLQHKCVCHLLRMTDTPDKTDPLKKFGCCSCQTVRQLCRDTFCLLSPCSQVSHRCLRLRRNGRHGHAC